MALLELETRASLTHRWLQNDLFGSSDANSSNNGDLDWGVDADSLGSPWKFQIQNAKFIVMRKSSADLEVDILHNEREHERAIQATFPATLLGFGSQIRAAFGSVREPQSSSSRALQEGQQQDQTMAAVLIVESQCSASPDALNWLTTLVAAHRQLTLSPYFQQFLGTKALLPNGSRGHEYAVDEKTFYCFEYLPVQLASSKCSQRFTWTITDSHLFAFPCSGFESRRTLAE